MSTNFEKTKWFSYTSSTETTRTWARQISTYEDIPEPFQAVFPKMAEPFPYTIFVPEEKASKFHERNSKIITMFTDHFMLWEQIGNEIITLSSPFTEVLGVEHGIILLKSWLKIDTLAGTFEISFNTANERFFYPIIESIRQKMIPTSDRLVKENSGKPDLSHFDFLNKINFKFKNYGRVSVQDNDIILAVAYQPEQILHNIGIFKQTLYKRYKTDFLIIVTREELIFIKEDAQIRTNFDPNHGGIFTYIPQHQIQNIAFIPQLESPNTVMQITLPNDIQFTSELSPDNESLPRLQELLET